MARNGAEGPGQPCAAHLKTEKYKKNHLSFNPFFGVFSHSLLPEALHTSYLTSPSSTVRRSRPARPAPVWAPQRAPQPPLCGQNDLTRTWVGQVIPTQNAPPSGRHPRLWWHQAPGGLSPACCSGLKTQAPPANSDTDSPHTQAFDGLSSAGNTLLPGRLLQVTSWSKAGSDISLGWPILSRPSSAAG